MFRRSCILVLACLLVGAGLAARAQAPGDRLPEVPEVGEAVRQGLPVLADGDKPAPDKASAEAKAGKIGGGAGDAELDKKIKEAVAAYLKEQEKQRKEDDDCRNQDEARKKAAEEEAGHVVGSDPKMPGAWRGEGLTFESANKDFRLHIGGRFDADAAWFGAGRELQLPIPQGGVGPLEDGADLRRLRLRANGQAYEIIDFMLELEFATALQRQAGLVAPTDVYVDITEIPFLGVFRAGHFREPFSMEALTSGNALTFLERSTGFDALVPFRNMGLMLYNTALDDRMSWAVGVFRNNSSNLGSALDVGDGEYAATGRVTGLPYYAQDGRYLVHLGAAYSHRSYDPFAADGDWARFRSFPEDRVGRYIFADTGDMAVESEDLGGLELGANAGPFNFQAELYHAWMHGVRVGRQVTSPQFSGWYAQVSYFLTGESHTYRRSVGQRTVGVFDRVAPNENFFFVRREGDGRRFCLGTGAWEVAARYTDTDLNDPSQGVNAQTLKCVTLGLNWYLNFNTKLQWNYILADRQFPAANNSGVAHILGMRVHMDF